MEAPEKPKVRSRVTPLEDVARFESLIGKKFLKRGDSSNHDVFVPKSIFPEYLMAADEMGDGGNSPFAARFCVERCKNGDLEPEPAAPQIIFGREIRARPPAKEFFQDCALFVEQYEEKHE